MNERIRVADREVLEENLEATNALIIGEGGVTGQG